jgi:hypothetical protein
VYLGEYQNDFMAGHGTFIYASGNKYEGQLQGGMMHGVGKLIWKNGAVYDGSFVMGKRQGNCFDVFKAMAGWPFRISWCTTAISSITISMVVGCLSGLMARSTLASSVGIACMATGCWWTPTMSSILGVSRTTEGMVTARLSSMTAGRTRVRGTLVNCMERLSTQIVTVRSGIRSGLMGTERNAWK